MKYDGYFLEVVYWGSRDKWHVAGALNGCETDSERYARMEEYVKCEQAIGRKIRSIRIVGHRRVEKVIGEIRFSKPE